MKIGFNAVLLLGLDTKLIIIKTSVCCIKTLNLDRPRKSSINPYLNFFILELISLPN